MFLAASRKNTVTIPNCERLTETEATVLKTGPSAFSPKSSINLETLKNQSFTYFCIGLTGESMVVVRPVPQQNPPRVAEEERSKCCCNHYTKTNNKSKVCAGLLNCYKY
jgi:hypothetical protein